MSFFGIPMRNGLSLGLGTVASLTNGPPFLPSELYYNGTVQGAWYDPSDLTTLFQDSAGTTPVTAVEQPVGLMLDKSKGLVLGPELVTSGNFTGWIAQTGWAISGGTATATSLSGGNAVLQNVGLVANTTYEITVTCSSISGGSWYVRCGFDTISGNISAAGTYKFRMLRGSNAFVYIVGNAGLTASFTTISVRELPGNHAFQSTSASRPTLRARYNLLTYSEQFDNAAWSKGAINTTGTPAYINTAIAPDGTTTADLIIPTNASAVHQISTNTAVSAVGANTLSVYAKAGGYQYVQLMWGSGSDYANFHLVGAGSVSQSSGGSAAIQSVGNGWYRCSFTSTLASSVAVYFLPIQTGTEARFATTTGDGTSGIYLWGAQLVPTAVFPSNTYQRVGAATDYATGAAFPPYLFFDGTDDSMLTNSVDFATVTSDGQARRNLLLNPTQFDASTWSAVGCSVGANAAVAPDNTATADTLIPDNGIAINLAAVGLFTAGLLSHLTRTSTIALQNIPYTASFYVKANNTLTHIQLRVAINSNLTGTSYNVLVRLADGVVVLADGTTTSENVGNGWYRITLTFTPVANAYYFGFWFWNDTSITCNGTQNVLVWGAQLETGSTATAFQNIGTDKMLVVAGVTKNSDATGGLIAELGSVSAGGWYLYPGNFTSASGAFYTFLGRGTAAESSGQAAQASPYAAPRTDVLAATGNIAGPLNTLSVSRSAAATGTASQGTGNFGNYPLYIGRRNNASLPFNGNIYSLVIAGQSYSSGQISSTESWVAAKTPLGTI